MVRFWIYFKDMSKVELGLDLEREREESRKMPWVLTQDKQ